MRGKPFTLAAGVSAVPCIVEQDGGLSHGHWSYWRQDPVSSGVRRNLFTFAAALSTVLLGSSLLSATRVARASGTIATRRVNI